MTLAQPGWLVLLVLPPLLVVAAVLVSRTRRKQWAAFVAPRLRGALLKRGSSLPRWLALSFSLAACVTMIAALARPQGDDGTRTEKVMGRNVMVALDLSRSMRVTDVRPDRLGLAKVVIYELLEAMPSDRVGLIGFAGKASLFAPLTVDHAAVRETVDQIDESWPTVGGSDLSSAVRLATETLKETGQKNNALVIISDGEEHNGDLDAMIAEAERSGVYIFAIGVGTQDGGFVPNKDFTDGRQLDRAGQPVLSLLQPEVLRKLAEETGGRYALAGSGTDIPAMVNGAIQQLDAFEVEGRERRVIIEFYQWLLLPGILFLLIAAFAGTRWRGLKTAAVVLAAACLTPVDARAEDENADTQRRDALKQRAESARSDERAARYRLGEGSAAYRAKDFRGARSAFSNALLSDSPEVRGRAHHGMGNTLFQLGWLGLSEESYPGNSEDVPDLDRFDTLVREQLERMLASEVPENGETDGYAKFNAIILNWSDAIRHYQSALAADPAAPGVKENEETTRTYLKRLRELLKVEEKQTQESMPEPQQGQGQPQEGDPQDGEGGDGEPQEGEGGRGEEENENGSSGENEPQDGEGDGSDQEPGENDTPDDGDEAGGADPNESPEERARRILAENADLEKGAPRPGRIEFRNPEKDW